MFPRLTSSIRKNRTILLPFVVGMLIMLFTEWAISNMVPLRLGWVGNSIVIFVTLWFNVLILMISHRLTMRWWKPEIDRKIALLLIELFEQRKRDQP